MNDKTGGLRMICPRCGMEQPTAVECVHCGVVVGKYKDRRRLRLPAPGGSEAAGAGLLGLVAVVAVGLGVWWFTRAEPTVGAPPPMPSPLTDAAPNQSAIDEHWAQGAAGFRQAAALQMEQKLPVVVYFNRPSCPECYALDQLWRDPTVDAWLTKEALRVRVDVEATPENAEIAGKFGVTAAPAVFVVRTNGERKAVSPFAAGGTTALPAADFVAALRAAAGR